MKTKKVILFIVEGITDKTSLGGIIDRLVKSDLVKFYITGGDVTSDKNTDSINAVSKVNELVKRFLLQQLGINKNEDAFVEFIRNEEFAVQGEYRETWEFIKLNGNSLKRYSNFQLFFQKK